MISLLLQLFLTFFLIGMFTFGGGYAMLTLIQNQVVTVHGWITESTFTDIVAVSQMTPGPIGINSATYVGYEVAGVAGSFVATLAIVLPSFIVVLAMVKAYEKIRDNAVFKGVMSALKPTVTGLIAAAAVVLTFHINWNGFSPEISVIKETFPDFKAWILFALSIIVTGWTKINPIFVIVGAGILGYILY